MSTQLGRQGGEVNQEVSGQCPLLGNKELDQDMCEQCQVLNNIEIDHDVSGQYPVLDNREFDPEVILRLNKMPVDQFS